MYEVRRYDPASPTDRTVVRVAGYDEARGWAQALNLLARARDSGKCKYPFFYVEGGSGAQLTRWNNKQRTMG